MKVVCVGGGPAGLFFATLLKRDRPDIDVVVFERNRVEDTFGFGVVASDATLGNLARADPIASAELLDQGVHWDHIEVRLHGQRLRCGGNGMAAITRKRLLSLLQRRADDVGVEVRSQHEIRSVDDVADADLIVAADGANSGLRSAGDAVFEPSVDVATAKFIWLGTTCPFDGLTFLFERTEHGVFAAHCYPIGDGMSTFIVETDEASWRAAGLDAFDVAQPAGPSDEASRAYLQETFAAHLHGHELLVNNSRWGNFRTVRNRRWSDGRLVLIGDAAHTAHFSVGSGTKMAMEDAASLAGHVMTAADTGDALADAAVAYEADRRPGVERVQSAAGPSLSWWEHFATYYDTLAPEQFAFHFLSRAIGHDQLAMRDAAFVAGTRDWWATRHDDDDPLSSTVVLDRVGRVSTTATVRDEPAARVLRFDSGLELALDRTLHADGGTWAFLVDAPDELAAAPAARDAVEHAASADPAAIVIEGGSSLTRTLLSEHARLVLGVSTVVVDTDDADRQRTLLLSGRADAVAVRAPT